MIVPQCMRPAPAGTPTAVGWWDTSIMLMLGGIPWNCYFQRVLSCRTPCEARWHSLLAGVLTIAVTVPPLLLGMAAFANVWGADAASRRERPRPTRCPLLLRACALPRRHARHGGHRRRGDVQLQCVVSCPRDRCSAGTVVKRLLWPALSGRRMTAASSGRLSCCSADGRRPRAQVQSVQALWFFTSDLVFVLLFPQLDRGVVRPPGRTAPARSSRSSFRWCCEWAAASRCSECRH